MKRHLLTLIMLTVGLSMLLTACANQTALSFYNQTECGTATITLTNMATGNLRDYTVAEGREIEIELDPDVDYIYEVTYPRQPDFTVCDSQKVNTRLPKGQTVDVTLTSMVDPVLEQTKSAPTQPTPTPTPAM